MEKARLLSSLKICLLYTAAVRAFSPVERGHLLYRSALSSVQPSKNAGDRGSIKILNRIDFLSVAGSFVTGAIVSSVQPVEAAVTANPSSSMYLSDEIKTIDMSMPSYDKVNTLKADEKALGVEDIPEPKGPPPKKQPKKKSEGSSGGMGSILPSMNKSGPSNKPKPAKKAKKPVDKVQKSEKEEPKFEFETMDMGLPSYSEGTAAKEKSVFAF